jgi:hypothetical protein
MVRSEITVNECDGSWNARETPDAIDKGNGHVIAAGSNFKRMLILVHISAGTGTLGDVVLKAGDAMPAFRRGLGDLSAGPGLVANDEKVIGPIETARFLQSDGTIILDITDTSNTDIAGTVEAYELP